MAKVYVGNLAGSVTSVDLVTLFARAGQVRGALAVSDKAGICRGFGFVEMADAEDAVMAISLLNNTELNGRKIQIDRGSLGGAVANGAKHTARRKAPAASN
jgi:RNA recognition motif-containing protein